MLNTENNFFPGSAALFLFCKEILLLKNNNQNKVTDQDVGSLLGFDPADCTHWKHGRKNIKSIQNIHKISSQLGVDERNLVDLLQGKKQLFDLLHDYKGYGEFTCEKEERTALLNLANHLTEESHIKSIPVLLPELLESFPEIEFVAEENLSEASSSNISTRHENERWFIGYSQTTPMSGALRFLLARNFTKIVLQKKIYSGLFNFEISEQHVNLFSLFLLTPSYLLQLAYSQVDPARDMVEQIARQFWLTRSLINVRLKDFLMYRS